MTSEAELDRLVAECQAAGPRVLAIFEQIIAEGETPRWAAMCALQAPPGAGNVDRHYCEGQMRKMDGMSKVNRDAIQKRHREIGFDPGNKFHVAGLGSPMDPAAWVTCAEDVLTIAKKKNLDVSGAINHKAIEKDTPPKNVELANDIISNIGRQYIGQDPALGEKCRKSKKARMELKERIVATHGKKARKHKH